MKLVKIQDVIAQLQRHNEEIRYQGCFEGECFSTGVVAFRAGTHKDDYITHSHQDVVCHVLMGTGRLRLEAETLDLKPGSLCHIPRGTPHDFVATGEDDLLLVYSLITTS